MIKSAIIALLLTNTVLISLLSAQTPVQWDELPDSPLRETSSADDSLPMQGMPTQGMIEAPLFDPLPMEPIPLDSRTIDSIPSDLPIWSDSIDESSLSCDNGTCDQSDCNCNQAGGCGCNGCSSTVSCQWTPWQNLDFPPIPIDFERFMIGANFRSQRTRDRGIGYERVMFAPNVLDTAIQTPHVGFRYQLDYGLRTPDRAEYYWGQRDKAETGLNVQDVSVRLAVGNEKAMALTQYNMRSLDPEINANTTGFGDMVLGAQALLVDGKRTKIATIFRTYLATGPVKRGLGTGHTSLEYGLLARQCLRPETYLFAEIKYWMPIKGTDGIAGDVLSTGWGISTIAAESDVFAFLPTFEIRTLSFLFGGQNATSATNFESIDGETAIEFYPGARFVLGPESDLGLWELGCAAGFTAADKNWFDSRLVFEARLAF
ncbi:hypothetical protein [Rubripirellula reticaptiva]|uniref:Uncharacterized protein n=1 Tax=Rubripirellula reticaptiva TaxID=2528013 RepID=A0A5C6F863_9BACT|nr:hypothetical protein [Rubripirellula reticaptiva]TWU56296.1 hypothetical protein Poly59_26000 [Rubripirellula reticaptiva]